jgi:predicted DsbA family dithiol-disulfide isomerase
VAWVAFPLHPEIPEEGMTLEELFSGRNIDIPAIQQRLKGVADSLSLPLVDRTRSYNSRLAEELRKWAESEGKGDEFHREVFKAYFAQARNIGRVDELVSLAASVGLPEDEARHVLVTGSFRNAVDSDWTRSRALGITAVPTFIIGGQKMVGFQPYEALEQLVQANGARRRA